MRERRKLKRQAKLLEQGILTLEEISKSYQSWRGSMKHRNSRRSIHKMDILYKGLFERSTENDKNI